MCKHNDRHLVKTAYKVTEIGAGVEIVYLHSRKEGVNGVFNEIFPFSR